LPENLRPAALQYLVEDIKGGSSCDWPYPQRNWSISTGFFGGKHINLALTEGGRTDVAYRLLTREEYPSWLFPVKNGATTIWERWNGWTPKDGFQNPQMNSFNHYSLGAVGEWMYSTITGIDADAAGFKKIRISPIPGGGLTYAAGQLETPYGPTACRWQIDGERFSMSVTVPPNTTATIRIPAAPQRM
jgi:alpha-L-rhamnosidase